ncbi:hypothetical protein BH09BAC2_BH09BAC2_06710 [soil metagenome]
MFFILSKLLISLLAPLTWIIIFMVAGLIFKNIRRKKICFITSLILLLLFTNPILLNIFARKWDAKPDSAVASKTYSCAIVLGGYAAEDESEQGYFSNASDRFIQGVKLITAGTVKNILLTGASGKIFPTSFKEAEWAKQQAAALNVPDSSIIIENKSRNTFENAQFSKLMLYSLQLQPPYLLVTSAFHMRRSLYVFKKAGVDVIPYPCAYIQGRDKINFGGLIPSAGTLADWEFYIKEAVGLAVYKIKS